MKIKTPKPAFARARTDAQKHLRRHDILQVARTLFALDSFDAISMDKVAAACRLAKGSMYIYFRTKEELFLSVLEEELQAWFATLAAELEKQPVFTAAALAQTLCTTLETRTTFTRLLAILHTKLEHNIGPERLLQFKDALLQYMQQGGQNLERKAPFLKQGQGMLLLLHLDALVIGLQHLADPSPAVQKLLQLPHLAPFRISFATHLRMAVPNLLAGMQAQ
jgi:AcrR family transcriptional regulator